VLEKIARHAGLLPDIRGAHEGLSSSQLMNNIDDAKSALRVTLRAVAKPGLAIEL